MAAQNISSYSNQLHIYNNPEMNCEMVEAESQAMIRVELPDSDPNVEGPRESGCDSKKMVLAEIDTSAPFDSVKEAVTRFGGIGFWKPVQHKPFDSQNFECDLNIMDISKVEAKALQLEKELVLKESQTFDLLKDLESTKMIVEKLKAKIQNEASEANEDAEKENQGDLAANHQQSGGQLDSCPLLSAPGSILMELKQAKLNLSKTTIDLADIRATVESYNQTIEKERKSLENTRRRLSSSTVKISSLEEDINQTKEKLQLVKDADSKDSSDHAMNISRELHRLNSETDQFKRIGEAAKSEVSRAISEIEQTNSRIKTAEIRFIAAKKLKEAARATEAVALAEMRAISESQKLCDVCLQKPEGITLSFEEYYSLTARALKAEEQCKKEETDAMLQVDEANVSQTEILKRVEEVTKEVKTSKDILEEALKRVESANKDKMAVEETLRKWRSVHGKRRRSIHKSTKFKNSHQRKGSRVPDDNSPNTKTDDTKPILRPTLSIGQILSRKLLLSEEFQHGMQVEHNTVKRTVSLGQMLGKTVGDNVHYLAQKSEMKSDHKKWLPAKRKNFGLSRISLLVTKQSKKTRQNSSSRVTMCRSVDIK